MHRRKKSKRGIIDEDIPRVSQANARRQVIYGAIGFALGLAVVTSLRPRTGYLLEMLVLIGVVASCTLSGMKLAQWIDANQKNLKDNQ